MFKLVSLISMVESTIRTSLKLKLLWIIAAIYAGAYITGPLSDPDLWWHIVVGKWILAHAALPSVDYWNQFGVGQPWRPYSWSIEVLFAATDLWFGPNGLFALKLLLGIGFALTTFYVFGKLSREWFCGALIGLLVVWSCHDHFTLRPQSFVWIYLVSLLGVLNSVSQAGKLTRRTAALIVLIMALWANSQITTVFGVAAAFLWVAPQPIRFNLSAWRLPIHTTLLALLGTLITPHLGGEWITFFSKSGHPLQYRAIAEFQPATILQYPTAFLIVLSILALALVIERPHTLRLGQWVFAAGLSAAALAVVKFMPMATIALGALICATWGAAFDVAGTADHRMRRSSHPTGNLGMAIDRLGRLICRLPAEGVAFVLLALTIVGLVPTWREPISSTVVPIKAVDYIIDRKLELPLLHDFGRGGYVMYRFSDQRGEPSMLVPIDGRTNVTPHQVMGEYLAAERGGLDWRGYFDRVRPKTVLWRYGSPLVTILREGQEYCQVFEVVPSDKHLAGDTEVHDKQGFVVFISHDQFERRMDLQSENCKRPS